MTILILYKIIVVILLCLLNSSKFCYWLHKPKFIWNNKSEPIKPKEEKKKVDYWIEFYPMKNLYAPVYKGQFPFCTVSGTWRLHDIPSSFEMFKSKEQAEDRLKLFLEWYNRDTQIIEVEI